MEISSNLYCKTQEITIRLCLVGLQRWSAEQRVTTEEGMATHSSFLAWRIPWTEEPGGLQPMGSQRVRHDWADTDVSLVGWDTSAESPEGKEAHTAGISVLIVTKHQLQETRSKMALQKVPQRLHNINQRQEQITETKNSKNLMLRSDRINHRSVVSDSLRPHESSIFILISKTIISSWWKQKSIWHCGSARLL